jgi:catechol 2,3-dioxygenase-like lactoylglutathione lyase family enzyme
VISRLSHAVVYVLNQDSARAFYTEKLGFEIRTDVMVDGFRWLTVGPKGQPELEIILAEPKPPMFRPEAGEQLRSLIASGAIGAGAMATPDCRATYEELKARGVTFVQEPAERPYGVEAVFRDDSGNWFSLTQRAGVA